MEQMALNTRPIRSKRSIDPSWLTDIKVAGTSWSFQAAGRVVHPLEDPTFMLLGSGSVRSIVTLLGDYGSARDVLMFFAPRSRLVLRPHTRLRR